MTRIVVKNNDWDGARAKLKTSLEAQQSAFNDSLKAAFAPPMAEDQPDAPQGKTDAQASQAAISAYNYLRISRVV